MTVQFRREVLRPVFRHSRAVREVGGQIGITTKLRFLEKFDRFNRPGSRRDAALVSCFSIP